MIVTKRSTKQEMKKQSFVQKSNPEKHSRKANNAIYATRNSMVLVSGCVSSDYQSFCCSGLY